MTCVGGANWDASRDVIRDAVESEAIGCVEGFIAADGGQDCSAADVMLIVADQGPDGLSSSCMACFQAAGGSPACYTCAPPADGCACTMTELGLFSSEDKSGISDGCWRCTLGAGEDWRVCADTSSAQGSCSFADTMLLVAENTDGVSSACMGCVETVGGEAWPGACFGTCTPPADGCACTWAERETFPSVSEGCWRCVLGAGEDAGRVCFQYDGPTDGTACTDDDVARMRKEGQAQACDGFDAACTHPVEGATEADWEAYHDCFEVQRENDGTWEHCAQAWEDDNPPSDGCMACLESRESEDDMGQCVPAALLALLRDDGDGGDRDDEAATCNFQALMEAVAQALGDDDPGALASSDVYLACASVATQIADTNIVASCKPPSIRCIFQLTCGDGRRQRRRGRALIAGCVAAPVVECTSIPVYIQRREPRPGAYIAGAQQPRRRSDLAAAPMRGIRARPASDGDSIQESLYRNGQWGTGDKD